MIYTPTNNFTGVDTITYTVGDHLGGFATATITVLDVTAAQLHRLEITASNSVPVVRFTGLPCTTYQLENATTISGPWSSLGQFTAPSSGVIEHTSTNPPTGTVFFRMVPPTP